MITSHLTTLIPLGVTMKNLLLSGVAAIVLPGAALANCPAVTVENAQGVAAGAFPQQYDLTEFEAAANCNLTLAANPAISELNARIFGNPELPALADRLPAEPLVAAPYTSIGKYGGQFDALSNATES
jgi:peptide/nickel transport system substrate-binding protein